MASFPIILTARLKLCQIQAADIPRIVEYAGNPKISATTLTIPHPYEEKDAIRWINGANQGFQQQSHYTFAVRLRSSDAFLGGIGLAVDQRFNRAELGYWIAEPFWGQGYATEATQGILTFGFNTLNLHKIYATHLIDNPASGKVMIKNGMIKEGVMKDHYKKGDDYQTIAQYRLTRDEYSPES